MNDDPPNRSYYRAVAGRWRGDLALTITDWDAFSRSGMSLMDRLLVRSLVVAMRLFGPFRLETSVDASAPGVVVHTTRVAKWGITMMRSLEHIALAADGRAARMRIEMRAPIFSPARVEDDTPVVIDAAGLRASYRFSWFGAPMRQEAERNAEGTVVTLLQTTSFSRSEQRLQRV